MFFIKRRGHDIRQQRNTIIPKHSAKGIDHQIIHVKEAIRSRVKKEDTGNLTDLIKQCGQQARQERFLKIQAKQIPQEKTQWYGKEHIENQNSNVMEPWLRLDIKEILKINDVVKAKILNIGDDGKISLSIKKAQEPQNPPRDKAQRNNKRPVNNYKPDGSYTWMPLPQNRYNNPSKYKHF